MRRVWVVLGLAVALGLLAWWPKNRPLPGTRVVEETEGHGDLLLFSAEPTDGARSTGSVPAVHEALQGVDVTRLIAALRASGARGVWFPARLAEAPSPDSALHARMSAGRYVEGFRADVLQADGFGYVPRDLELSEEMAARVLARAARAILGGAEPPAETVYPKALAIEQPVEVLVALREGETLRLWRSARARSIPAGLALAAIAARDRWTERSEAMGGPLSERLSQLTVEVWLLLEDGSFEPSSEAVLDALVSKQHGVAFEQPTRWRYFLPGEVRRIGSGSAAFKALFKQNDLPADRLFRSDRRLYRFVARTVSVDAAGSESD